MSIQIKENNSNPTSLYRPEIDGLRAFAVIAVIINHFNKEILPNGYLGVDIFFIISGFVITSSLYQRPSKNFKDFISGFYERRIKRLIPALAVFVLLTSIAICLFDPGPVTSLKTGITSLFGLSNLYLLKQSTDYFAQSSELNVFTHTWSLGVEEQFYILFRFLIWFSGFGRQTKNGVKNLLLILGALTIISLIGFLSLYSTNQSAAYFMMPTRFWEMASGCLLFIGIEERKYIEQLCEKVPPILILGLIVGIMYLPMPREVISTVAVIALSAVLILSLKKGKIGYTFFTNPKIVYIGLISYSLYLWHWSVLSISRWTIGIHWWSVPFQIIIMFGLAIASYRWIETPLRRSKWFGKRWKTFLVGGSTVFTTAGILVSFEIPLNNMKISRVIFNFSNGSDSQQELFGKSWHDKSNPEKILRLPSCHYSKPVLYSDLTRCVSTKNRTRKHQNQSKFFIVGDSHAANYVFGFEKAFPEKVSLFTIGHQCGYLPKEDAIKNTNVNCVDYVDMIDKLAESMGRNDFFILGYDWQSHSVKKRSRNLEQSIRKLASKVTRNDAIFILLDDVPDVGNPLNSLKTWYRPFGSRKISKKEVDRDQFKLDNIGNRLDQDFQNAFYLSLRKEFCDGEQCSIKLKDKIIYFDQGHLTVEASEKLSDKILNFINDIRHN